MEVIILEQGTILFIKYNLEFYHKSGTTAVPPRGQTE